jgi:hypothetical protein
MYTELGPWHGLVQVASSGQWPSSAHPCPYSSLSAPPRKINDDGNHQVCCIYMTHIIPYSPSIVLWCMTKLPICQMLNGSQDNLFSTHSWAFHFAQLSLGTVYEFSVLKNLKGWGGGVKPPYHSPHLLLLVTVSAHQRGDNAGPEPHPTTHTHTTHKHTLHLNPFSVSSRWMLFCLFQIPPHVIYGKIKICLCLPPKDLAFGTQRKKLEELRNPQPSVLRCQPASLADLHPIHM